MLTNKVVSFEQFGPVFEHINICTPCLCKQFRTKSGPSWSKLPVCLVNKMLHFQTYCLQNHCLFAKKMLGVFNIFQQKKKIYIDIFKHLILCVLEVID